MKIIAYSSCSLLKPAVGVLLDESLIHIENGDEVHFVYCDKVLKSCSYNLEHNSLLCNYCQSENKRLFNEYLANTSIDVHCLSEFHLIELEEPTFDYTTVEEVKVLLYKGVEVGASCLSSYISTTRNSFPRIDDNFKSFFNPLLKNACVAVNDIISMLDNINPDKVLLFNGRLFDVNATIAVCKQRGIPFTCLEVADLEDKRYKLYYENALPHDPIANSNMIEEFWQEDYITLEEKKKLVKTFLLGEEMEERLMTKAIQPLKNGIYCRKNFDVTKRNFAIFNSSEDELASLGKQFESKNLFPTQLDGIKYVLNSVKDNPDIHFYLRIHPNLAKIGFSYHTDLYKLPEVYNNITVIGANEEIDSYALMEACEKVVAFASTMGIESVYWKKPVIILGNTFYYDLNGFYKPTQISQIHQLLVDKLDPLDNSDSIKYGFFLMAKNPNRRFKHVDFDFYTIKLPKFTAITANYQKWLNSRYFFSIRNLIILSIVRGTNKFFGRGKK